MTWYNLRWWHGIIYHGKNNKTLNKKKSPRCKFQILPDLKFSSSSAEGSCISELTTSKPKVLECRPGCALLLVWLKGISEQEAIDFPMKKSWGFPVSMFPTNPMILFLMGIIDYEDYGILSFITWVFITSTTMVSHRYDFFWFRCNPLSRYSVSVHPESHHIPCLNYREISHEKSQWK